MVPAPSKERSVAILARRRKLKRKPKSLIYKKPSGATKRLPRLRSGLEPGSILILLSGGYRGRRVVFLKQLSPSGLLLVTGPFKINGVPLRRVNQRYVIVTSTKVDISGVDVSTLTDAQFGQTKKARITERKLRRRQDESLFVQQTDHKSKQPLPEECKQQQDSVDQPLLAALNKDKLLTQYLKTRFTLRNGMAPHTMKF